MKIAKIRGQTGGERLQGSVTLPPNSPTTTMLQVNEHPKDLASIRRQTIAVSLVASQPDF